MASPDDLLTTAEVASMRGKTVATINRWAADGKLPVAPKLPGATAPTCSAAPTWKRC